MTPLERMMFVTGCAFLAAYAIPVLLELIVGTGKTEELPPKPRTLPPPPPKPPRL